MAAAILDAFVIAGGFAGDSGSGTGRKASVSFRQLLKSVTYGEELSLIRHVRLCRRA